MSWFGLKKISRSKIRARVQLFRIPLIVVVGIVTYVGFGYGLELWGLAQAVIMLVIGVGSFKLLRDTFESLRQKQFALDYIALLAISTAVFTGEWLVAAVIVLMLAGGNTLEEYGMLLAKKSLTALANRLPHQVQVVVAGQPTQMDVEVVSVGQKVLVRKGEVIALDGIADEIAEIDESSLTGEPEPVTKSAGDRLMSGTVNVGDSLTYTVTAVSADSGYAKIIAMVAQAQKDKPPLVRLADRYSTVFTLVTLLVCAVAYLLSGEVQRVLAVLVIATPCPLILATPIALMGGMNAAAKRRIVLKRLASLEVLSRVKVLIFDKTGTVTIGQPTLVKVALHSDSMTEAEVLRIAAGLEKHSYHPLAKAVVSEAKIRHLEPRPVTDVSEILGKGIRGTYQRHTYSLTKEGTHSMSIILKKESTRLATLHFEDEIKKDSVPVLRSFIQAGYKLMVFTGDHAERAKAIFHDFTDSELTIQADCSPADKQRGITSLQRSGKIVAMVGDGINDAPALATADVGIVFSHEEHTASSEAADVVLLGGNLKLVAQTMRISHSTINIALQSILFGIGASLIGMVLAAMGYITPVMGAFIQEAIDVAVILNALRTTRL